MLITNALWRSNKWMSRNRRSTINYLTESEGKVLWRFRWQLKGELVLGFLFLTVHPLKEALAFGFTDSIRDSVRKEKIQKERNVNPRGNPRLITKRALALAVEYKGKVIAGTGLPLKVNERAIDLQAILLTKEYFIHSRPTTFYR